MQCLTSLEQYTVSAFDKGKRPIKLYFFLVAPSVSHVHFRFVGSYID